MQVPQEVAFLESVGLSSSMIISFGVFQVVGGLLTAIPKTKIYGSAVVIVGFLISSVLIFLSGDVQFGLISIIPAILAGLVFAKSLKTL